MYVALGPNPLMAIIVNVFLVLSTVDFAGNRVCKVVVSTHLGKFVAFLAYVWYLTGVGLNQLPSRLELATLASRLHFVGIDSNGHLPLWVPILCSWTKRG